MQTKKLCFPSAVTQLHERLGDTHTHADAWYIFETVTQTSKELLIAAGEVTLSVEQQASLNHIIHEVTINRQPLQYAIGTVSFGSLTLKVRPPILIPRHETEQWVTHLIAQLTALPQQPRRILDLCTGSGCIALSLAQALPNAQVTGTDISEDVLALARENAQLNGITNVSFLKSDLFGALDPAQPFDLIVSNPPYVTAAEWKTLAPRITLWEDRNALVAAEDGLAMLRAIATNAPRFLTTEDYRGPQLVLEFGDTQAEAVTATLHAAGYKTVHIWRDYAGRDRAVFASIAHMEPTING